jgi:hypothetical protein
MLTTVLTRLRALLQRRRVSRELDDELRFHAVAIGGAASLMTYVAALRARSVDPLVALKQP